MTRISLQAFLLFSLGFFFLGSCGKVEKQTVENEDAVEGLHLENAPVPPSLSEKADTGDATEQKDSSGDPEVEAAAKRSEPVLRVFFAEGSIVLEGALKSKIQIERIESQLGEFFSGTRIENRLELDYDRIPVGWGNRVADGFLIPFLSEVEEPFVEYDSGIITLKGKATRTQSRTFHQLAGVIFAGAYSKDIKNEMETKEGSGGQKGNGRSKGEGGTPQGVPEDFPLLLE